MISTDLPYLDKTDPWSSHAQIAAWLKCLPPGTTVLDVGAATGMLGRRCVGLGLRLKGIEPNPAWAEQARPYYQELVVGSIEQVGDDFIRGAGAVVLADVLEHLPSPEAVLERLVRLQPPDCRFLISVPNVANLWIRLNLLLGRFEYTERGILDRTHLRFFTRSSFIAMLEKCGLQCEQLSVTPIPLNLVNPFFQTSPVGRLSHTALARLTHSLPTVLGYQFLSNSRRGTYN